MNGTPSKAPRSAKSYCFPRSPKSTSRSASPTSANPGPANPARPASPTSTNPGHSVTFTQTSVNATAPSVKQSLPQPPSTPNARGFSFQALFSPNSKKGAATNFFETISKALTPQNVASAYDGDRTFVGLENQNQIKSLLTALSEKHPIPFLLVIKNKILFSLEDSDVNKQFYFVDISTIPPTLTQDSLHKLGQKLDEGTVNKINLKLKNIQSFYSIQSDHFKYDLEVYPSQNAISINNQKIVFIFSSRDMDSAVDSSFSSEFRTTLSHKMSSGSFSDFSFLTKNKTAILSLSFDTSSKSLNPFLKDLFASIQETVDANAGIKIDSTQLFSTYFYQILNPENKASKEALFSSIKSDDFKDSIDQEILLSRLQDGSYPYGILLKDLSTCLKEELLSYAGHNQHPLKDLKLYFSTTDSSAVLLLKKDHIAYKSDLLERIAKDALTCEYTYSIYLGDDHHS